jgi:hypothetical protein
MYRSTNIIAIAVTLESSANQYYNYNCCNIGNYDYNETCHAKTEFFSKHQPFFIAISWS